MQKLRCTSCRAKLKLPGGFSTGQIRCPQCGVQFGWPVENEETGSNERAYSSPEEVSTPDDMAAGPVTETSFLQNGSDEAGKSRFSPDYRWLDFKFQRYLTPAIIRVSWFCVLVLGVLWLLFLVFMYAGSFFSDEPGPLSGIGLPDLQGLAGGGADVASNNDFLDNITGALEQGSQATEKTFFQSFRSLVFKILAFLTMIASLVLTVLWCRVIFETIIVVFEMAKSMKNIDEKTGRQIE